MTLDEILAVPVHGTISRSRRRVNFGLFWFPPSRHRRRLPRSRCFLFLVFVSVLLLFWFLRSRHGRGLGFLVMSVSAPSRCYRRLHFSQFRGNFQYVGV